MVLGSIGQMLRSYLDLNFLLFPQDNSISFWHTTMTLHTRIDHHPRKTSIDFWIKWSKVECGLGLTLKFEFVAAGFFFLVPLREGFIYSFLVTRLFISYHNISLREHKVFENDCHSPGVIVVFIVVVVVVVVEVVIRRQKLHTR